MGELRWCHWFWVTLALGAVCVWRVEGESLGIEAVVDSAGQHLAQHGEEFPPGRHKGDWFGRGEEAREEKEVVREEREQREERVVKETVSVSKSSSVSKVSVKMGGVSVRHPDTEVSWRGEEGWREQEWGVEDEGRREQRLLQPLPPLEVEARVRESFFQRLLSRLQDLADVRVREEELLRLEEEAELLNTLEENSGYQLIYREDGEEYADYYSLPIVFYTDQEYDTLEEPLGPPSPDLWHAATSDLSTPETPDLWDPETPEVRSPEARGRALSLPLVELEDDLKEMEEAEEENEEDLEEEVASAVSVGVTRPNVDPTPPDELEKEAAKEVEEAATVDNSEENFLEGVEVVIDRSRVELLTFRNKIGIFIGVVMIVLTVSVVLGMAAVSIRRARRGKRMIKEDEMSQAETVSTVMETSSYQGLPDSVYSNYIRKSSLSCDELTELDNDSFLTSLETISVMDRFAWD